MGLRIATNIASELVQRNLRKANENTDENLQKLSSGKRITKAADDAAGMAIATNLKAQTQGLRQATRNANDGVSLVQTAEGGLNEVSNILIRLRELSVQAASDTIGDTERGFLNEEYQELTTEVDRIASSTKFNGTNLLNGESGKGEMDIQVGVYAGDDNTIQYDADGTNVSASNLNVDGSSIAEKTDALDNIENIDTAMEVVSAQRAKLGAIQSRLRSTVNNLEVQTINQEEARSVIEDVDVASATSDLTAGNVIKSAGIATLSQANNIPNAALRLIK